LLVAAARSAGVEEVSKLLKALQGLQGKTPDEAARRNRWTGAVGIRENLDKLVKILRKEAEVGAACGGLEVARQLARGVALVLNMPEHSRLGLVIWSPAPAALPSC
jgi:hypothetical protein